MTRKLAIYISCIIALILFLSFVMLLIPTQAQRWINSWFESGQVRIEPNPNSDQIKIIEPLRSDLTKK